MNADSDNAKPGITWCAQPPKGDYSVPLAKGQNLKDPPSGVTTTDINNFLHQHSEYSELVLNAPSGMRKSGVPGHLPGTRANQLTRGSRAGGPSGTPRKTR